MKRLIALWGFLFITLSATLALGQVAPAAASSPGEEPPDLPRGAALYDKWYAVLGVDPPPGNMPLWSRQTSNTRSGPDTWRCVSCHGWDYQGKDGAYRAGNNYTGFPGLMAVRARSSEEVIAQLSGKRDPQHDFSPYLSPTDQQALTAFLQTGLINDNDYIDPVSLKVLNADSSNGKTLYEQTCASCHGADGAKIAFRFEGTDASLVTLANRDPWRFLHKTRFGTPGTAMPVGYQLGWKPEQGRDVLRYVQSLPTGREGASAPPSMENRPQAPGKTGGPANDTFSGILTALGAMLATLGFNLLVAGILVGIILLLVWALRGRK